MCCLDESSFFTAAPPSHLLELRSSWDMVFMCIYMLYMERSSGNLKHSLIRKVMTPWHELLHKLCFCGEKLLGLSFSILIGTSYIWWTDLAAFTHKAVIYSPSSSIPTCHPCSTIYSAVQSARRIMWGANHGVLSALHHLAWLSSSWHISGHINQAGKCFSSCEEIHITT